MGARYGYGFRRVGAHARAINAGSDALWLAEGAVIARTRLPLSSDSE
jgi:hypothetical protein